MVGSTVSTLVRASAGRMRLSRPVCEGSLSGGVGTCHIEIIRSCRTRPTVGADVGGLVRGAGFRAVQ